jgi:DNA polymerase (family 10)
MPVHNADIAAVFEEMADLLEIANENPFRIRAYRNAARTLQAFGQDLHEYIKQDKDLQKLPGIGKDLAGKIEEIIATGRCQSLEKLRKQSAPGLTDLLKIPGLGPKRVRSLYDELDIHTLEQLHRAAIDGRISEIPGFGKKTQENILRTIATRVSKEQRFKLAIAARYAEPLVDYLKQAKGVSKVVVAGSYRRCKETVGDIDILVTARAGNTVMEHFGNYDEVDKIVSKGNTRATVILKSGIQVDVRVVAHRSFGAALHYFTGSKAHNIAIRRMGQKRGLKINEYGVFKGKKLIAGGTEASVYKAVGLPFIEPELRENRGEIAAARAGQLPKLVTLADLQGDLHAHTTATDGHDSLEDMIKAAQERGFKYLAITEHSRHLTVAHGLDQRRLLQQVEQIDRINDSLRDFTVLKGIEVDILDDGRLDLPDTVLAKLDLVIGAVHSRFNLSREQQTRRILKAMDNPYFTLLAHPTGRLIQQREPYDVDMGRIIRKAGERGCFMELNAHPERMDLLDTYCMMARDEGVPVSINSDAHSVTDFDNLPYGIGQARRGWLEKRDVLNTRPLKSLKKLLGRTMA